MFELHAPYLPSGHQPQAIDRLVTRIEEGCRHQVLLGVTGSGKTFTIANVIARLNRPALLLAPNKTLAAQLYTEMRSFFPENAVEYFVSYYDYYQPEAFVPSTNTYIEKDASINKHIEQMRLRATRSIMERNDTVIIATVSAIYGLGDPESYQGMSLSFRVGERIEQRALLLQLIAMQYARHEISFVPGHYRVRGDCIDIFPSDEEARAVRVALLGDEIEGIFWFDPLTGERLASVSDYVLYPKTHYVSPEHRIASVVEQVRADLEIEYEALSKQGKILEAHRLKTRVQLDIEMMEEIGYCQGIENYARYLSGRGPGETPATLLDYLPANALLILDESHVMLPQIRGMYAGDRSRKNNLVDFGFRLSSALDNRPLMFEEFESFPYQRIYVSATPGAYEQTKDQSPTELVVRPTGLLDPKVVVRPQEHQVSDVLQEIRLRIAREERVLITTLTQKMAENLTEYLQERGIKVKYIHAKIDTVERSEILRSLRLGVIEVVVGINLLREGLDLPEVSLVAIFDADKEGFLRSGPSLIQTIGRAARHVNGEVILYAQTVTQSMKYAMDETERRRCIQSAYNELHGITPASVQKKIHDTFELERSAPRTPKPMVEEDAKASAHRMDELEQAMLEAAKRLDFERAKELRDQWMEMRERWRG